MSLALTSFHIPLSPLQNTIPEGLFDENETINAFCFLNAVRVYSNFSHKRLKKSEDSFVCIHTVKIRKEITSLAGRYTTLINKMINCKVIECDRKYSKGSFSMGYRIGPALLGATWQYVDYGEFLKQFSIGHRKVYQNLYPRFAATLKPDEPIIAWQKESCRLTEELKKDLSLDLPLNITDVIDNAAQGDYEKYIENFPAEDSPLTIEHFRISRRSALDKIEKGTWNACIFSEGFAPRLFNCFTNLSSSFRQYARIEGEELFNLDIRNSQPCLLPVFYNNSPEDQAEKAEYINTLKTKDLYALIGEKCGLNRAEAKKSFFIIMFAENYMQKNKVSRAFKSLFPILSQRLHIKKEKDFKQVAKEMQTTEAEIVIKNTLLPFLQSGGKGFSIHDSIMVRARDVDNIQEALAASFESRLKFRPVICKT
jgi:hypothetical protein